METNSFLVFLGYVLLLTVAYGVVWFTENKQGKLAKFFNSSFSILMVLVGITVAVMSIVFMLSFIGDYFDISFGSGGDSGDYYDCEPDPLYGGC